MYTVVILRSMVRIRPVRFPLAGWPSGLRRWFKAPVSSEARVRISHQSVLTLKSPLGIEPAGVHQLLTRLAQAAKWRSGSALGS